MSKVTSKTASSPVDPYSIDPNNIAAWEDAQKRAKDAGIQWERPANDQRSAEDILKDTPLLRDLGNQSGVRDALEQRVGGDIQKDANAAYRAAQVLKHIERFDGDGKKQEGDKAGNGRIDGFTKGGEAEHGSEAGRLQDFGKYGFKNLKGDLNDGPEKKNDASPDGDSLTGRFSQIKVGSADDDKARKEAEALGIEWIRPEDDKRSAKDIIGDSPMLRDLIDRKDGGKNRPDIKDMKDNLKKQVGDYENDADAAYRAAQVLKHIEKLDSDGKPVFGNDVGNGKIDGLTSSNEVKPGTEAGRLKDFGKYGFSHLKGKLESPDKAGGKKEDREAADKAGIKWELPEGDKRSAKDIIEDNPLLKNLGNQSGVKDMLKDRVGDFEKDANAAYRAAQVLDRITKYDEKGNALSGDGVSNTSIDGFTKSGEAEHGTEAGRLQDFGKYGFSALPEAKKSDVAGYKDFLKANPKADETSKTIAKYAALIGENFDVIKTKLGAGDTLTADDLKKYAEKNPHIDKDLKEALNFWSQPGAFKSLETAQDPLKLRPDGKLSKDDVKSWIKNEAPKDAASAIAFLSAAANGSVVNGTDTSKLNSDLFKNPDKYSTEDKAAALRELLTAQQLIIKGAASGMWKDDYSKVAISNRARTHPDPKEVLKDLNEKISILESDQKVVKYLNENSSKQVAKLLEDNPGLKDSLQKTYDNDIKSGSALNSLWDAKTKDGKTDQPAVLAEFYGSAKMFQEMLGIQKPGDIQDAVKNSKHNADFESFYEKSLVSGDRLKELLKDNSFEKAVAAYSAEVALYNAALNPEFTGKFDQKLNDNFTKLTQDSLFKDAKFEDLQKAFGVNGGKDLDEDKVKKLIEQISKDNPELFINPDGKVATPDQIIAGFRGTWDMLRQGTKSLSELKAEWLSPDLKKASDKGVLHGVSGLMMAGLTISRGIQSGGNPTDKQIVDITTGSIQSATLLTEGGVKNFKDYLKGVDSKLDPTWQINAKDAVKKMSDIMSRFENAAKGLGGIAGIVAGAYGIFDGVQSIRKGDAVSGGIGISTGSLGVLSGLASAVEGGVGAFGSAALRAIMGPVAGVAGVLGLIAAGAGAIAALLPGLIEEGKQQTRANDFGDLLGSYLTKYEIDGIPNGNISDLPESAWPGQSNTIAS